MKMVPNALAAFAVMCSASSLAFGVAPKQIEPPVPTPADGYNKFDETPAPLSKSYPYGEPKIEKGSHGWNAILPAKGFSLVSQWTEKPEFNSEFGSDAKSQGAVSLTTVQIPEERNRSPVLHALIYIYDPKATGLDVKNPDSIIEQLITAPTQAAEQQGAKVKVTELKGKVETNAGVTKDVRRAIALSQEDQNLESHYYRVLVGKDFVVLALVIGPYEALNDEAQKFFDGISLKK